MPHKDQTRIEEKLLPYVMERIVSDDPEAVRDCTVLNRLLIQGPDPLYLMETCPAEFSTLCGRLGLDEDEGRAAIEAAHWQGPGVLLEGTGLPVDSINTGGEWKPGSGGDIPLAWRKEALWLLLAAISDCTEDGYSLDVSLLTRIQRGTRAAIRFSEHLRDHEGHASEHWYAAAQVVRGFLETEFEFDDDGHPHSTDDHGFYIAYKKGYPACAVHVPDGPTFWGTVPGTSLDEQGIQVDKKISEQFGLVFP